MKTYIYILLYFFGVAAANARGQLGVQLSPGLSINRVYTSPNNVGFSAAGGAFRFKLGAIYDYPIQDRYYVSTGILYAAQHLAIKNEDVTPPIREKHTLRYLQAPVLLKLYTSELKLDTRLYVALGILNQFKVHTRNTELPKNQQRSFIESFRRWSWGGLLGIGAEYDTSFATSFFLGISYYCGFSNVIDKQDKTRSLPQVMGYTHMLSVDMGVRF